MAHGLYTLSKPSKKSQISWFCFQNYSKEQAQTVEKVLEGIWKKFSKIILIAMSHSRPVHPSSKRTISSPRRWNMFFPEKAVLISYVQNVATLNEAGISTPSGSVLCTVHRAPVCPPLPPELRAAPRLWSQTAASCKPSCHQVTWYRGSAVPGWSSSCQIFSYSSFSSSFCGWVR